jgi:tripartite-type tricarboxylate transporter receptor subunit TctC
MRTLWHSIRLGAVGLALGLSAAPAFADAWPQRSVRVVVPVPPGVGLDVITRLYAERLAARWRQPVVVENLPGADGIIAIREFATKRDNHTLFYYGSAAIIINTLMYQKLPYNTDRDLVPIATASENALAIAVPTSLGVGSLGELAKLARSRPGKLTWAATPGGPHFAFAAFEKSSGAGMVRATYRDFNQALIDLREGRIDAVAAGVAPLLPHARAGKIKLLAFVNSRRAPVAPDVPTAAEAGYPDVTISAVTGFFGWRDMPGDLREQVAVDIRAVAADAAVGDRLAKIGSIARGSTPAEFAADIEAARTRFAAIAKMIGLKPTK